VTHISLDLLAGTHIDSAAKIMVEEANKNFSVVKAKFNGFELSAAPFCDPIDIVKQYNANRQRTTLEYRRSPEYKESQRRLQLERIARLNAPPKEFPLGVVLSVTTGRLLTKPGASGAENGIYAMYEFIDHCLATDECFDITAGAMAKKLKPLLITRFPELDIPQEKTDMLNHLVAAPHKDILIRSWIRSLGLSSSYVVPVMVQS
jgi:hypothetical protein